MQTKVLKTKKERGEFLESDFIDRLIRIEQRTSAKFGKLIKYTDTYCYQNLSPENRKKYSSFLVPLFGILFLFNGITGNVVKQGVGETGFQVFYWIFLAFIVGMFFGLGVFYFVKTRREKRFGYLFKPLENIKNKSL